MRVLLVCVAGMSTSLLVNNMMKFAAEDEVIDALPVDSFEKVIEKYDVILVGPQIRYKYAAIEKICKKYNKAVGLMDMQAYGQMDGKKAIEQARSLVK